MKVSSAERIYEHPVGRLQNGHAAQSKSHEANDLLSLNHLPSHNNLLSYSHLRNLGTEMDIRGWSSRLKKKFKPGNKNRKPDRPGAESGGESVNSASSLAQPLPHVVTGGGHNQVDDATNLGVQRVRSNDGLPPPDVELVPVRGGDNEYEGEGGGVDGGEVSRRHSRGVATGSGCGQEGNGANEEEVGQGHPSPPTRSIPHGGKPDGSM